MAKLLLIETATEVCSAAIAVDGRVIALAEEPDQPNHAARLTLLIQECTRQAGLTLAALDAVALSRGPGSYTSLRVGSSVAKGICYALDKPLLAVDTLRALAGAALAEYHKTEADLSDLLILPMLDARRKEVWTAVYDAQLHELVPAQPLVLEHNLFADYLHAIPGKHPESRYVVTGNGGLKLENEKFFEGSVFSPVRKCSAAYLSSLALIKFQNADFQDISYFEPFYMKMPNITTPGKAPF